MGERARLTFLRQLERRQSGQLSGYRLERQSSSCLAYSISGLRSIGLKLHDAFVHSLERSQCLEVGFFPSMLDRILLDLLSVPHFVVEVVEVVAVVDVAEFESL